MKLSIKNRMPIPRIGLWIAFFFALGSIAVGQVRAAEDEYAAIRETLETCFTCRGPNGASTEAEFPILAGQHYFYLYVQ